MNSAQFLEHCSNDTTVIHYVAVAPGAKDTVEKFAHRQHIKALLYVFGEKIITILLTLLQTILIKKYGN
jgi:hypothetical protein